MHRRRFLSQMLSGLVTVGGMSLVGCGGGGGGRNEQYITISPGGTGRLQDVAISPNVGSAYISRTTNFLARWTAGTAPRQFTASLQRYKEADNNSRSIDAQKIEVSEYGTSGWRIRRKDNFTLEDKGVYFVELSAPGEEAIRGAYIVADGRAATRAFDTGGNGSLDGIQISPPPGEVFISRNTTFVVTWPAGNEAPPRLGLDIYRYEEQFGESKNNVDVDGPDDGQPLTRYTVRRREGVLEKNAVYILRITNDAGDTRDYVYIVNDF